MIDMEIRNRRIQEFEDTLQFCEREQDLIERIAASRESSVLWHNMTQIWKEKGYAVQDLLEAKRYHIPCKVLCWNQGALDLLAILKKKNGNRRIGTLLLSTSTYFGGNVLRGEEGEEEKFCRYTTLYPCLEMMNQQSLYYKAHSAFEDQACVYVRDVVCLRRGRKDCKRIKPQDWFLSDVIMYTSEKVRRPIFMGSQQCPADVLQEYEQEHYRSLEVMLQMAIQQNLEELVIPVSQYVWNGCELTDMLERMQKALQKYTYFFRAFHLVFA